MFWGLCLVAGLARAEAVGTLDKVRQTGDIAVGAGAGMWPLLPKGSPDVETARERPSAEEKAKNHVTAGEFRNDADEDRVLCLEIFGEEVILSPGHVVERLVPPDPALAPRP